MPQIQFKGKQFVQNYHLTVPYHELIPQEDKTLTDEVSLHDNLIIHGDNLRALKALLPLYAGKVKCIYIDPPYNTGNEGWAYNDNVSSPMMQDWLGKVVDREDLTRHDKWLCMMMPRLKLLRELLSDDGVIFVSIDENESHNLRMGLDEVFGEDNFMAHITVLVNPKGRVMREGFAQTHEYLMVYRKTALRTEVSMPKSPGQIAREYPESDERGPFRRLELRNTHRQFGRHNRPNLFFPVYCNEGTGEVSCVEREGFAPVYPLWDDGYEGCWTWGPQRAADEVGNLVCRTVSGRTRVYRKAYAVDRSGAVATKKPTTIWQDKRFYTERGQSEVDEILGQGAFYAPKPSALVSYIIQIGADDDSTILDSFAGSGTTAHAVLALNKEDGGNRRFILVECEDYADSITAERVRRVIKGVPTAKDEALRAGLGGTFSYFELGKPIEAEKMLSGESLPSYRELARYVFYTATGEQFDESAVNEGSGLIGESREHRVYLFYKSDVEELKKIALTLDRARLLEPSVKRRLVFAPTKFLDQEYLEEFRIDFAQLPFEIYRAVR